MAQTSTVARSLDELEELVEIALDPAGAADGVSLAALQTHLALSLPTLRVHRYSGLLEFLQERPGLAQLKASHSVS